MASLEGFFHTKPRRRQSIEKPPSLRLLIFGVSGHQFSLTQSILQMTEVFPDATLTRKSTVDVAGINVTLVNVPDLDNHNLSYVMLKNEFRKSICFTCPGPHAVLFVLNPFDVPSNAYEIFKPVVHFFGESILKHTIVVLYHEGMLGSPMLKDRVNQNRDLREIKEKCSQRSFIFDGWQNRADGREAQRLLEVVKDVLGEHEIFSNPEFKDADQRIKKEEKYLEKQEEKNVRKKIEELEKKFSGDDLDREVKLYKERLQVQNRNNAELQIANRIGFTLRLVDYAAAIGKGAFVGALLGLAMGHEVTALGAVVGASLGGVFGGAVKAAWTYTAGAVADVKRDAT